MRALIHIDRVIQVDSSDFPVASPLFWVDCPNDCDTSWLYNVETQTVYEPTQPEKTDEEYIRLYEIAISDYINSIASSRGYDNAVSISTYVSSTNPSWKAEADAFVAFRDLSWEYFINIQDGIRDGLLKPTSVELFLSNAPVIDW